MGLFDFSSSSGKNILEDEEYNTQDNAELIKQEIEIALKSFQLMVLLVES